MYFSVQALIQLNLNSESFIIGPGGKGAGQHPNKLKQYYCLIRVPNIDGLSWTRNNLS